MPPLKHSPVWTFFSSKDGVVSCNDCHKVLKANSGNTSNLKRHLEARHPLQYKKLKATECENAKPTSTATARPGEITQATLKDIIARKDKLPKSSSKVRLLTSIIAKMICVDYQPFSIVEDQGFRSLMLELIPQYELPTRQALSKDIIPDLYQKKKELIIDIFKRERLYGLAIATDTWTSKATDSYLALTAHFVDSHMKIVSLCLAVRHMDVDHTASNLAECIQGVLSEFDISSDKLNIYIVTDNARNMLNAVGSLAMEGKSCFVHTLQLVINDALKKFPGISKILTKCRAITGHFKHSTNAMRSLEKAQIQLQLPKNKLKQDVSTRFNSTYYMMERQVQQKRAINLVLSEEETNVSNLSGYEWRTAEQLVEVLKPFEDITTMMSGETYPTMSMVVPALIQLMDILGSSEDLNDLRKELLDNLKQRWPNFKLDPLFSIAMFIDPRFKLVSFSSSERNNVIENVIKLVSDSNADTQTQSNTDNDKPSETSSTSTKSKFWKSFEKKVHDEYSTTQKLKKQMVKNEIDFYLQQSPVPISMSSKSLTWWSENEKHYPHLINIARRFLCVPATSVPSERLFSSAGAVACNKRCQLESSRVEQIVFLNMNWDFK